jgi:hypothetical protein
MQQRVPPDRDAQDDPDKARVQSQDLEHQRKPETRVSNTGVTVKPAPDEPERRDDETEKKARKKSEDVVEEFERSVREQVPG